MKRLLFSLFLGSMLAAQAGAIARPTEPGESAFAALAEIAARLRADPTTDWSRVDLLALREHLVDMSDVTLRARVEEEALPNGVRIRVTGEGRTLEALRRMIPMHSSMVGGDGWRVDATSLPDGYRIDLTSKDPAEAERLRALGFFGFLTAGDHHRRHHLGIASGAMSHGSHGDGHEHHALP